MNKKAVVLLLILGIACVVISIPFWIVVGWHLKMTNFKEGVVGEYDSFDGHYTIQLSVEEDDYIKMHYANVSLIDNITGEEIFCIKNEYRAFDFHWVVWENENYNFWLKSGDIGTFCYEFQNNNETWIRYEVAKKDKKHCTLRTGIWKNEKYIEIEEIMKRLPEGYSLE